MLVGQKISFFRSQTHLEILVSGGLKMDIGTKNVLGGKKKSLKRLY
jgi:hypothetical protein